MWQVFFPRNRTKYRAGFGARTQSNFKCKSHGTTCSALLLDHVANELYVNTRKYEPFVVWNRNLNGGRWHLPILTIWAGMCDLKVWVWAFFHFGNGSESLLFLYDGEFMFILTKHETKRVAPSPLNQGFGEVSLPGTETNGHGGFVFASGFRRALGRRIF